MIKSVDDWWHDIAENKAAFSAEHPDSMVAAFAVNQIVHRSNQRLEQELETIIKQEVRIVISARGLVAVAAGAGGHAGTQSSFALVQQTREWLDGPLILSGTITHGRAVLATQEDASMSVKPVARLCFGH